MSTHSSGKAAKIVDSTKEAQIVELLNESETYMEKNMNAAVNNMSVLTLHSFDFANHLDS
jgi:hypothetical protein